METKEVYVDKDAVEHFKALCSENGIAFRECGAYSSYVADLQSDTCRSEAPPHLVKFAVKDKNNVMGIKIG